MCWRRIETENERWDGDERKEENAHLRLSIYIIQTGRRWGGGSVRWCGGSQKLAPKGKESKRKGRKEENKEIRKKEIHHHHRRQEQTAVVMPRRASTPPVRSFSISVCQSRDASVGTTSHFACGTLFILSHHLCVASSCYCCCFLDCQEVSFSFIY